MVSAVSLESGYHHGSTPKGRSRNLTAIGVGYGKVAFDVQNQQSHMICRLVPKCMTLNMTSKRYSRCFVLARCGIPFLMYCVIIAKFGQSLDTPLKSFDILALYKFDYYYYYYYYVHAHFSRKFLMGFCLDGPCYCADQIWSSQLYPFLR